MLELKNTSFAYGKKTILSDVSLTAKNGELLVLLGANGAGKSTLLKIISGLLKTKYGEVWFREEKVSNLSALQLAKFRAVLEQECQLAFNYSVLEVVKLGGFSKNTSMSINPEQESKNALMEVGLSGFENRMYFELSGGEKRRVQMARAIYQLGENCENKLLLLDEPSAGLDPAHAHLVMSVARKIADKGAIVLAVLHDINLATAYADKIALLKNGKILKADTVSSVLDANLISQAYDTPCELIVDSRLKYPFVHFVPSR